MSHSVTVSVNVILIMYVMIDYPGGRTRCALLRTLRTSAGTECEWTRSYTQPEENEPGRDLAILKTATVLVLTRL